MPKSNEGGTKTREVVRVVPLMVRTFECTGARMLKDEYAESMGESMDWNCYMNTSCEALHKVVYIPAGTAASQ